MSAREREPAMFLSYGLLAATSSSARKVRQGTVSGSVPVRVEGERGRAGVPNTTTSGDRRTRIVADISARLKNVCSNLSEIEFRQMVEEMADCQLRGERRTNTNFPT
jgi:hypothetical protein